MRTAFLDKPIARYGVAVVAVIVAALLRLPFSGVLSDKAPFITFYPAVMVVAMLCGFRAGVLATLLSALAADFWVLYPSRLTTTGTADAWLLAIFVLLGVFISAVSGLYRRLRVKMTAYEAELARQASEEQYRELVENANSAILRWNRDGAITFFNEYAQRFFGYTPEEVIGKSVSMLVPDVDSSGADLKAMLEDIVDHPEAYTSNTNENVLRDGRRVWMAWTNRPIFDENGQLVEIFAVGGDITAQRRAEAILLEVEAQKQDFYRRTILAATEGKLRISDRREVAQLGGPPVESWAIRGSDSVSTAMANVKRLALDAGMEEQRAYEFLGCVTEAATNVLKHAGEGSISMRRTEDSLICVVSDFGPGIGTMELPEVALTRNYSTAGTLGMGYKQMIHFADKVYLATGPDGTAVAIEMAIKASQPKPESHLGIPAWS